MYKINKYNLKREKDILFILVMALSLLAYAIYNASTICLIISIILMIWVVGHFIQCHKKEKLYNYLAIHGTLLRKYPYTLKKTKSLHMIIVVNYNNSITLESDIRYDGIIANKEGLVDLLINPENPKECYIDFDIEEY